MMRPRLTSWLTGLLLLLASTVDAERLPNIVTVVSGVTTNTTSAVAGSIPPNPRTFFGQVVCSSGACTQTQAIYGAMNATAANGILLCTLTLSGTTRAQDACPVVTAVFPFYYVITTNTSGTAAMGDVVAVY